MTKHILIFTAAITLRVAGVANDHDRIESKSNKSPAHSQTNTAVGRAGAVPNIAQVLPPLPDSVVELKFSEFFKPIGPRGLEYSDKLRGLTGRRVRVLGYMVRQSQPVAHQFLLAPMPLTLHEHEYGFAEDMPASLLHVIVQTNLPASVPFTPGLLLLTGTLGVGNRQEADGRISTVRLALDPPGEEQKRKVAASAVSSYTISTNAAPHTHGP